MPEIVEDFADVLRVCPVLAASRAPLVGVKHGDVVTVVALPPRGTCRFGSGSVHLESVALLFETDVIDGRITRMGDTGRIFARLGRGAFVNNTVLTKLPYETVFRKAH